MLKLKSNLISAIRNGPLQTRAFTTFQSLRNPISETRITDRMSLANKNILVNGGGRGIGFAVCKSIAQMGGNVSVIDTLPEPVPEFSYLPQKYGIKAKYFHGDVTDQTSLESAFTSAAESAGHIHGLVSAAGIVADKPFFDHTWSECEKILQVNTLGTFWITKLVSQHIAEHGLGGSIVLIASIAAQGIKIPQQNVSIYNMSKAGVKGLAGPLAVELAPYRIRVNTVSPGVILSPMTEGLKKMYPELLRMFESAAPVGRIGVPEDLTPAIYYLLSDASSFQTGTDVLLTGGLHAGTAVGYGLG